MYLALARKYRPQDFTGVIGQDPVVKTLKNVLEYDRLHHAYLFCGARGVGKTSMARIFAKSINCEKGPTITPCQVCESCQSITSGRSLDVLEIDGASNTGVDNVRELREQVKYLPHAGKYKIYIIDEVHMLSTSAFNALLKTLEEPPEHVIFIFATTEPHKIPITILSRCQRYDFRKVNSSVLISHMKSLLEQEKISSDEGALHLIADCAGGSVRDSLSLLDQVIGFHPEGLEEEGVRDILGLADRMLVQSVFTSLVNADLDAALQGLNQVDEKGLDLKLFAENLLKCYRHLILTLSTSQLPKDLSPSEVKFFEGVKSGANQSLVLAQYQILFRTLQDLSFTDFQKTSLEVGFVKLQQAGDVLGLAELVEELKQRARGKGSSPAAKPAPARQVQAKAPAAPAPRATEAPTVIAKDWYELVSWVQKRKPPLGGALNDAVPIEFSDKQIVVGYSGDSPSRQMVIDRRSTVEELLQTHFGKKVAFEISEAPEQKKKS